MNGKGSDQRPEIVKGSYAAGWEALWGRAPEYLPCDCCGSCEGAVAASDGTFFDGQDLVCGCRGHVSMDAETPPYVTVDDDCTCCERCMP